jgi:hypothetical protein
MELLGLIGLVVAGLLFGGLLRLVVSYRRAPEAAARQSGCCQCRLDCSRAGTASECTGAPVERA